jgi:hypothetical protein
VLDKLMWRIVHDLQPDVAIDEAEAGLVGALDLDGTDGEPALPTATAPMAPVPTAPSRRSAPATP